MYLLVRSGQTAARATVFFFLMIRRPPRSTLDRSSAASDVYKRQELSWRGTSYHMDLLPKAQVNIVLSDHNVEKTIEAVSYTHLRAHETVLDLVCRLLLENKTLTISETTTQHTRR